MAQENLKRVIDWVRERKARDVRAWEEGEARRKGLLARGQWWCL
jgi:hypothetical protein